MRHRRTGLGCLAAILGLACLFGAADPKGTTFQDLMDPAMFPDPQCGLTVESVTEDSAIVTVTTAGAVIRIDADEGKVSFRQRIAADRPVATLFLEKALGPVTVTHRGPGLARITTPACTIRINGDSLFLVQVKDPAAYRIHKEIDTAWHSSWKNNHLIVDEYGGFGLYGSELNLPDAFDPYANPVAAATLPAGAVLGLGVCPPKAYPWEKSMKQQIVWHWSNQTSYPPDEELHSWKEFGDTVLLQSEVMLWKDWNLDFIPRLGMEEWRRVADTIHGMGMPFIVYTSPYYFLKGTSQEKQAVNDQPGVCPGAVTHGENMPLFLDAITRVMTELKPDGLYFDGQYAENPAALYALARYSRAIIGEDRLLEWHSTLELGRWGSSLMYMPQADAYTDVQLRGEGSDRLYQDFDYLRYFVSGYNINNCIGVLCNNSGKEMAPDQLEAVLRANARLHTLIGNPTMRRFVVDEYRPRLTAEYPDFVNKLVDERQGKVAAKAAATLAFLKNNTMETLTEYGFDTLPDGEWYISPSNPAAPAAEEGMLHLHAHAHTYAFLRIPVNARIGGVEIKLRQNSDRGMSWGPAAMVRWEGGAGVRIGARAEALQVDIPPMQILGPAYQPENWVWIRARWRDTLGIVEYSLDGITYNRFHTFAFTEAGKPTSDLLIGKVPSDGEINDYKDPGAEGDCFIDYVKLLKGE